MNALDMNFPLTTESREEIGLGKQCSPLSRACGLSMQRTAHAIASIFTIPETAATDANLPATSSETGSFYFTLIQLDWTGCTLNIALEG
jgi:hypothetical protein